MRRLVTDNLAVVVLASGATYLAERDWRHAVNPYLGRFDGWQTGLVTLTAVCLWWLAWRMAARLWSLRR